MQWCIDVTASIGATRGNIMEKPRKKKMYSNKCLVATYLTPDAWEKAKEAARSNHRSLANWVECLVLDALEKNEKPGES